MRQLLSTALSRLSKGLSPKQPLWYCLETDDELNDIRLYGELDRFPEVKDVVSITKADCPVIWGQLSQLVTEANSALQLPEKVWFKVTALIPGTDEDDGYPVIKIRPIVLAAQPTSLITGAIINELDYLKR